MARSLIFWPLIVIAFQATATAAPPNIDKSFSLPILAVDSDGVGHCHPARFKFSRRPEGVAPLAVAVIEDTPAGAGAAARASLWLATMVAALDRMDPLSGASVSLELSGQMDGPSAGAAICLAVLSSLDGRDFPQDCAVTGTIMPDGTIGDVGGIAAKMRGAAKAGIRRVMIPAYLRFEKQADGEEIDLKRLATSLKLELLAVENVTQAYAALHGLPAPPANPLDRRLLEVSEATEEALKLRYQEHLRAGTKLWEAIPEAERKAMETDEFAKSLIVDQRRDAERSYRAGRFFYALHAIRTWAAALQARRDNEKMSESLAAIDFSAKGLRESEALLNTINKKLSAEMPDAMGFLARLEIHRRGSAAQLSADYYARIAGGTEALWQHAIDDVLTEHDKPNLKQEDRDAQRQLYHQYKAVQRFVGLFQLEELKTWTEDDRAIERTLIRYPSVENVAAVERLFYNSHSAVQNTFRHDVIGTVARAANLTEAATLATLKPFDDTLVHYDYAAGYCQELHVKWPQLTDIDRRRFAGTVSAHLQAECLGSVSGLVTRWNQLEVEPIDDGGVRYGRVELLRYLLMAARENALRAMSECRRRGLPYVGPLARFEDAEMSRDDDRMDKVDVLVQYWNASLQAKVLLMICDDKAGGEQPRPAVPPPVPTATTRSQASVPKVSGTAHTAIYSSPLLQPKSTASAPINERFSRSLNPSRSPFFRSNWPPFFRPSNPLSSNPRPSSEASVGDAIAGVLMIIFGLYWVLATVMSKKAAVPSSPATPSLAVAPATHPPLNAAAGYANRMRSRTWVQRAAYGFGSIVRVCLFPQSGAATKTARVCYTSPMLRLIDFMVVAIINVAACFGYFAAFACVVGLLWWLSKLFF